MATTSARAIDEGEFRRLVEAHRPELHAHCYRMLGSLHDAEDALQETLLRLWRGLPGFRGQSSLRTWLFTIATNVCVDALARRTKRVLPVDHGPPSDTVAGDFGAPLVESVWIEPYPNEVIGVPAGYASPAARYEQREAVELAFVAALQHLPARQRAALILHEVLGFSAREVAESLETSVASVNSLLQRARSSIETRLPDRSQQQTVRALGDEAVKELVTAYVDAWMNGDVETVRSLLAEDAVFSMPPWSIWWRGRERIIDLMRAGRETCPPFRSVLTRANAQLAIAHYTLDPDTGVYAAAALDIPSLRGASIVDITTFVMPRVFADFGLPAELT